MRRHFVLLFLLATHPAFGEISIDVDLADQTATLIVEGKKIDSTAISSGTAEHPTPTGTFQVLNKEVNHFSTLFGRIVTPTGRVLRGDATPYDAVPSGARFLPAPMPYFICFAKGYGLHAGTLPNFPASHGCVRLPKEKARIFFEQVRVGDTVRIHGRAPGREVITRP